MVLAFSRPTVGGGQEGYSGELPPLHLDTYARIRFLVLTQGAPLERALEPVERCLARTLRKSVFCSFIPCFSFLRYWPVMNR